MKKYVNIKFACGHSDTILIEGKSDYIEWKKGKLEEVDCPTCQHNAYVERCEKAAEANAAAGLPPLSGTEKQILYGELKRHEAFEWIQEQAQATLKDESLRPLWEQCFDIAMAEWSANTSASKFIEGKASEPFYKAGELFEKAMKTGNLEIPEIFEPEDKKKPGVVCLMIKENTIRGIYPKDSDFMDVVKSNDFQWNGECWYRNKKIGDATIEDATADIAMKMLSAGFSVQVFNDVVKQKVSTGDYEPINPRMIGFKDTFNIYCDTEKIAEKAMLLPKARERGDGLLVKVSKAFAEEVEDFADTYGFAVSRKASAIFDEVKNVHKTKIAPSIKKKDLPGDDALYNHAQEDLSDLIDE